MANSLCRTFFTKNDGWESIREGAVLLTDVTVHILLLEGIGRTQEVFDYQDQDEETLGNSECYTIEDFFKTRNQQDLHSNNQREDPMSLDNQITPEVYELPTLPVSPDDERITDVPAEQHDTFNDEMTHHVDQPLETAKNKEIWHNLKKIYQEMLKDKSYFEEASECLTVSYLYLQAEVIS